MYTCAMVVCCTYWPTLEIPSPHSPPLYWPLHVLLPSLWPCVLHVSLSLMSKNMQCLVFCSCVSLLRIMASSFIRVLQRSWSHLFMAAQYSMVYMYHIFFIQSITDGHLSWFHVFAIVNSIAMNICKHVFYNRMIYITFDIYPVTGLFFPQWLN